jgi:hypothetical protein
MTREEAIKEAETIARRRGWPWEPPIVAKSTRRWILIGRRIWTIRTNANYLGRNVNILIDADTGRVLSAKFAPR